MSSVLTSWKEIANYFGKGVRTVQRWEQELALPVRRASSESYVIFAIPAELDAWVKRPATAALCHAAPIKGSRAGQKLLVKTLRVGIGRLQSNRQRLAANLDRLHAHIAVISNNRLSSFEHQNLPTKRAQPELGDIAPCSAQLGTLQMHA